MSFTDFTEIMSRDELARAVHDYERERIDAKASLKLITADRDKWKEDAERLAEVVKNRTTWCSGCGLPEAKCKFAVKYQGASACCPDCNHSCEARAKHEALKRGG